MKDERIIPGPWGDGAPRYEVARSGAMGRVRPPMRTEDGVVYAGAIVCTTCNAQYAFKAELRSYDSAVKLFKQHECKHDRET